MVNKIVLVLLLSLTPAVYASDSATTDMTNVKANSTSPSINPAAAQGMQTQNIGMIMNAMAATALFTACQATSPPNMSLCSMGAVEAAQSAVDAAAASQSADTFLQSSKDAPAGGSGTTTTTNSGFNGTTAGGYLSDPAVISGQKLLKDSGYSATAQGVTNPDGSFTPSSSFSSPSAMAAAGMDQATIDASKLALASVNAPNGIKGQSTGVNEGQGAGSDQAANDPSVFKPGGHVNPFLINKADTKKLTDGKTVMLDGEPIGVKGQDLFDMIHVAYRRKSDGNHFIERDTHTIGPASISPPKIVNLKDIKKQ